MSILIRGMEMPKSCGNCFFDTHCDNWRLRNWGAPPPDDCPLVEIPPHGDLIDRGALERYTVTEWFCGNKRVNVPWKAVADAPTIIPAEEGEK